VLNSSTSTKKTHSRHSEQNHGQEVGRRYQGEVYHRVPSDRIENVRRIHSLALRCDELRLYKHENQAVYWNRQVVQLKEWGDWKEWRYAHQSRERGKTEGLPSLCWPWQDIGDTNPEESQAPLQLEMCRQFRARVCVYGVEVLT